MDFQDVVRRRKMIRNFTDEPVDAAVLERALTNATRAPSAGFTQGWAFLVLEDPADLATWWQLTCTPEQLADPGRWLRGMMTAPVLVVPCSSRRAYLERYTEADKVSASSPDWLATDQDPWDVPYWHMDTAMATLLILQTAVDAGLGGSYFGLPVDDLTDLRETFGIPVAFDPIGVVALGHPAEDTGSRGSPARRARKPLDEVVHRGRWHAPAVDD